MSDETSGAPDDAGDKRAQILRGAAAVFARDGYEGGSMSRIAAEAGVSKGTLYNHFENKADLFAAWVSRTCETRLLGPFSEEKDGSGAPPVVLARVARHMVALITSPEGETVYRMVVSEAGKFPELARIFFEAGPARALASLAAILRDFTSRGALRVDDPEFAAEQFFALCQARIHMRHMLHLPQPSPVGHIVEQTVQTFLARYGADTGSHPTLSPE